MNRLKLQNKLARVRGWRIDADDLEDVVVVDDADTSASPVVMERTERDERVRADRIKQENVDIGLPTDRLGEIAKVIRVSMQAEGEFDDLARTMLEGDGLQRQYEYARLRCQNGGEPPRLFDGWQAWQKQHGFTKEPWWSKLGGYISYQATALPKRVSEWTAYQGMRLMHWVKDDLALRFQLGVWDEQLAEKWNGWGTPLAVIKAMAKTPGWIVRAIRGESKEQLSSADVKEKRAAIGQYARGMRQARAREITKRVIEERQGLSQEQQDAIGPTPDEIRELTELDLLVERMEAVPHLDELEEMQQQEITEQATRRGGFWGTVGGLIGWQGWGKEWKRLSFWTGGAAIAGLALGGPIIATIGGVGLVGVIAARRAKRRRNYVEHEREILDTLDDLRLIEGDNVLQLNRDGQAPLQFHVMGIRPSTEEILLAHESGQSMTITMGDFTKLRGKGVLSIVKSTT